MLLLAYCDGLFVVGGVMRSFSFGLRLLLVLVGACSAGGDVLSCLMRGLRPLDPNTWLPGSPPNLGKSKLKLPLYEEPLALLCCAFTAERGGDRPTAPEDESRFLYSRSSVCNRSTCAFNSPFSCLSASCALDSSVTLVSRSLRCCSLRSRKARCAALFCALRF